jgi:serine/threonine-protein kinase
VTLDAGSRLGVYEIVSAIGAGGMGEVYRAVDTNLGRDVAIKVLPEAFAHDPERLARFEREAKTLASLNHPNIAIIHGLEKSQGMYALVMELVEGEELSQRIARGPIPLDEALPIAKQIAEALEAAHEQGIIHRDLKPANIKVRSDGTVKVLDFGLAKLVESSSIPANPSTLSMSPTITSPALMSGVGVLLGTAAYMSPEQAKGKPADRRSDIWAFGCVLYEMLSGKRAFPGEDAADVLASIITLEPDWATLPSTTPDAAKRLLRRALEKNHKRRLDSAIGVRLDVEDAIATNRLRSEEMSSERLTPRSMPLWRRVMVMAAPPLLAAAIVGAGIWYAIRSDAPQVFRSQIVAAGPTALSIQGNDIDLAIAPDGKRFVYRGVDQLVVRAFDRLDPQVLTGLGTPREPFFSPDGLWIAYFDGAGLLRKVSASGGPPVTLAKTDGTGPRGATWGTDGTIVFATQADTGLLRVSAEGGDATVLTKPRHDRGESDHRWPEFLPGNRGVLFTIISSSGGIDTAQIAVLDLSTGKYTVVLRGGYHARYLASGYLLYGASGTLRAVRFDLKNLQVVGTTMPVVPSVLTSSSGAVQAVVAANDTLVYLPPPTGVNTGRSLVWVSRDGREEMIPAPRRAYDSFQLSPDGSRAVVQLLGQEDDIWMWDFTRRTLTRLTFGSQFDFDPVWTPDGRRIVFTKGYGGIAALYSRPADGTGPEQQLVEGNMTATSFSPDGKQLVTWWLNDIYALSVITGKIQPLVKTLFDEQRPYLSPDGNWLAYQSNESGENQIYVQPFPQVSGGRWQVSPAGGTEPAWSRNGHELFYIDGSGALVAVPVQTKPTFAAGNPHKLFDAPYVGVSGTRRYDVTADGQRFLFIKGADDGSSGPAATSFVVVQHWSEELKRLVPVN